MNNYKFIISGGGTGGHIYPAVAIAKELQKRYPQAEFLFVGAQDRMEMEKVPQEGFDIEGLWISGIQRKLSFHNLLFPIKLLSSIWRSRQIIKKFKPNVVVGTGGFASGPLLKAAAQKGVPYVLQEQNSFAGITNKWLAKDAQKICVAYAGMERFFPAEKLVQTGNPVRSIVLQVQGKREEAMAHFGLDPNKKTILVIGGSLGARSINQLIASHQEMLTEACQLLWQCGKLYESQYLDCSDEKTKVMGFIRRMDLAYAAADVIVSRAGAGSVSELCIVGKTVLFIPSPNVAEDHQTKNAQAIVEKEAALMLREAELEQFAGMFQNQLQDVKLCEKLAKNIKQLARPDATIQIVDEIEKLL